MQVPDVKSQLVDIKRDYDCTNEIITQPYVNSESFKKMSTSTVICDKGNPTEVPQNMYEIKSNLLANEPKIIGNYINNK